ncbi:probable F420-dependent oxidoreductase, Rv2161c family [Streptosporangium subroseum]|uniref:Probable F420-dependent oxidoreductase, Rv2161c family n=1 Tax=Streptosporangium subroseum TaxID=106412 RepID=A0A239MWL7_9ACTN|nr:probable F420-dependent oxidoreductase, Rv2161c family [Streptosporangium subroseum]
MEIGVVLPLAEYPWKQPSYSEIRALALSAEDSGFDSVWVFDHLLFRGAPGEPTEGIWESWTILSALAEATGRVRLGTLVLCTAFRNPAVLAKMAVTLDEVSEGRLILGLGSGWHEPEFEAFGVPFENRVSRFEESLHVITSLLRTGTLDFEGRHIRIRGGELRPRGVRASGPPILVAAFQPRMLRLAARHADMWNTCWLGGPSTLGDWPERVNAACAEVGRDPASLDITVGVNVVPGDSPADLPDDRPVLSGTSAQIAAGFLGYAAHGVSHLICNLNPHDATAQKALSAALHLYREQCDLLQKGKADGMGGR